jgi:hypothetical protein
MEQDKAWMLKRASELTELQSKIEEVFRTEVDKMARGRVLPEFPGEKVLQALILFDKRPKKETMNDWIDQIRRAGSSIKSK